MKNRILILFFLVCLSTLINIPTVLCMTPPTVYVSGDSSGDFYCDGTDDHEQINQALKYVTENPGYTTVYLKGPFTYVINSTLLIGNNTTLEGDSDAVIKLADNAGWKKNVPLIQQNDSSGNRNITIKDFKIDGNREENTNVNSGTDYYNLIHLSNCQNVDVYNMYLTNNHGDGLRVNNCSNIEFHDNKVYSLGHDVLCTIKCSVVEAYNNNITCRMNSGLRTYNTNNVRFYGNNITSEGYGGAGIQIQKEGNSYKMNNIEVYNNTIYRTALSGIWIFGSGTYSPSSANAYVHHNQIYDTGTNTNNGNIGGIVSDGFNVTIENNVIDGTYGVGIAQKNVYSSSPLSGSGYVITARNNIITNIQSSLAQGNGVGMSNFLKDTHSFVLQNNCFYNNSGGNYSNVSAGLGDIQSDPQYADRNNHDYHLKSKSGRWNGIEWVNDGVSSPCIDAGYPLSDYSNEPEPNGKRINIGRYGNTGDASKSEIILPVANFSANKTEGKAPLTIQFNDSSENAISVSWDFDNNSVIDSTENDPVYEFTTVGTFTVNLTATNENGTSSKLATIKVTEKSVPVLPVANFTANLTVRFIDTSINSPNKWIWDFGDGTNSTEQNPVHTFSKEGTYNVTLVATNDEGSSEIRSMIITVKSVLTPPVASFAANMTEGTVPLTVKFTDTSARRPTGWKWNFGDGNTSTVQNPVYTFSGAGTYNVTLVATNGDGSSDESSMNIKVNRVPTPPIASFTANQTVGTAPLTVKFTDTSTNSPTSWKWSFGDGQTSTVQNPEHTFSGEGTYRVTLTATNGDGSSAKKSMDIKVNRAPTPPDANFTVNQTEGTTPLTVKFTDTSTNSPTEWKWNFGDGVTSTDKSPVYTYTTAGTFTTTLNVGNKDGYDTASKTITVTEIPLGSPKASFTATPRIGHAPLTVKFTEKSSNATSVKWNFGDGTTSTESNPTHTYKTNKVIEFYTVTLTVTNGKESSVATNYIYVLI
ncbi:PKD domain-containing protein [Methanosarcina spelaei]|uniref:PKD domain-containing protein n=1 Tax=Methanosarcina spelaei TaxID=1036679 RepID=UPI000BABF291|nr:PKD domain-containing protein [Methanosarcina spelaei]